MDHAGMAKMFMSLEDAGCKGFLEASSSVFEGALTEFFTNTKVIAGKIVSFVANRKMVLTKDVLAEAFGLPTEGMVSFLDIPSKTMAEMWMKFLGTNVPFRAPNKKKEMKMECLMLHDIKMVKDISGPEEQKQIEIVGDPDPPPGVLPRWHLCLAPTGVSRTRRFSAGTNSGEVAATAAAHGGGGGGGVRGEERGAVAADLLSRFRL
ncbi:hypothetical protein F511_33332 [Dorcoceras hygrometricum]|uniref:Uncharacterized protein n=1 Tax=Dorcoceras hygrometricum TaxID=472368 RepID=A0A2Z7A7R8_9LAMI|nr:hypothetical protein F511_33332 [Dorcoceras hygrometricum]